MRSDDKDMLISVSISIIGALILYFTFLNNLDISILMKVLWAVVCAILVFFVVLAIETKHDFY